jgi:tetratricopeptide (TPR) repeat protein
MGARTALALAVTTLAVLSSGCQLWRNTEAYFNIYYNMHRLMSEVEEEFGYYDETRRTQRPRVFVPDSAIIPEAEAGEIPPFLREFLIEPPKLQLVQKQLDSILQKGSKILAFRARSDFVDNALFLMAQAFFYRGEWLPAQSKCQELLQLFPQGELAPDAQLLLAKAYLMQRKFALGRQALSRAVDIGWYHKRFDVLSEAFRLQAELALSRGELEEAFRPYRQAILLSPDGEQRARWQLELAALFYRVGRFEQAADAFAEVFRHSPSLVIEYEAKLYRAAALARSGRYREAEELLNELKRRRRYEQWLSYTLAQELALRRRMGSAPDTLQQLERRADSAFPGNPALLAVQYEEAMRVLRRGDYRAAQRLFARASVTRSPVFHKARFYSEVLTRWERAMATLQQLQRNPGVPEELSDSLRNVLSAAFYELGRVYAVLGKPDSAQHFYTQAAEVAPDTGSARARSWFALAHLLTTTQPSQADSLLEAIVACCPKTPYGREAQRLLGYVTEADIDTAAELYDSGIRLWRVGEYALAQKQLSTLVERFPGSPYAPRALYALGWFYEHPPLRNLDSAVLYYRQLVERYPSSEYAADVRLSVAYARARREGIPVETILQQYGEPSQAPRPAPELPAPPTLTPEASPAPIVPGPAEPSEQPRTAPGQAPRRIP